jgi:hypothetical protein
MGNSFIRNIGRTELFNGEHKLIKNIASCLSINSGVKMVSCRPHSGHAWMEFLMTSFLYSYTAEQRCIKVF